MKLSLSFEEEIEVCSVGEGNRPIKILFFLSCYLFPRTVF